ncbi:hypothetical protein SAMN04488137_4546 [Fictibacillus solisalsi]|uniref:Uncharacterized protein n=1 Tax=Fictibacillus solisalsi TaxID=459525 RepID=A0A1H0BL67_9BACL|nr:hypothetical protein [Fictibacillus solisalsi]SDN46406.1 hypothetical protein SAMN04488137_4546 [Fictibacillus solisalsi]
MTEDNSKGNTYRKKLSFANRHFLPILFAYFIIMIFTFVNPITRESYGWNAGIGAISVFVNIASSFLILHMWYYSYLYYGKRKREEKEKCDFIQEELAKQESHENKDLKQVMLEDIRNVNTNMMRYLKTSYRRNSILYAAVLLLNLFILLDHFI